MADDIKTPKYAARSAAKLSITKVLRQGFNFNQTGHAQTSQAEQFQQSLVEVLVMLSAAIILCVMLGIFIFIGVQGGRYFLPMSTFQITTYYKNTNANNESTDRLTVEYMLSHESSESLSRNIEQKIANQFRSDIENRPRVIVDKADSLFLLSTQAGQKHVGEFVSLQKGNIEYSDLSKLTEIRATVDLLLNNLNDIQLKKLQPLHKEINQLELRQVDTNTPSYQKKLAEFTRWQNYANQIKQQIASNKVNLLLANNQVVSVAVNNVQDLFQPNQLNWWQSIGYSVNQIYLFLTDFPKQASTSGGVFPAIFGTLLMVIIMALVVTPFGAISAIYLHEYAPNNRMTDVIRICVSNMAAVPSVVYGVFGLGFFVYGLGGSIDSLLYSEQLPSPTFGAPGLLWASLTMGILTLPVVIVATEEGLRRVPSNLRAGALALGATKYETITKVVLPMASPGILTGVILAIARAAGEVAPLILVGAVKFAPTLPIDAEFPFVHLERQFMHLGVFVYDGAFHNQTESQVSSLMFATCMLLLIIVLLLNISAIVMRNRLRNKYERL